MRLTALIAAGLILLVWSSVSGFAQDQSLADFRRDHNLSIEAESTPGFVSIHAELLVNRGDGWSTITNHLWLIWTAGGDHTCVGSGCRHGLGPGAYVVLNLNSRMANMPPLKADTYSIADWNRSYPPDKFRLRPYAETSSVYKPDHYQDLRGPEQNIIQQQFCPKGLAIYDHLVEDKTNFMHYDPTAMINICGATHGTATQITTQETQVPAVSFPPGGSPWFIADTTKQTVINDARGTIVCQSNAGFCRLTLNATKLDNGMAARGMRIALFVSSNDDEDADQKQYDSLVPEQKAVVQTVCRKGILVYERLYGEVSPDGRAISYDPTTLHSVCQANVAQPSVQRAASDYTNHAHQNPSGSIPARPCEPQSKQNVFHGLPGEESAVELCGDEIVSKGEYAQVRFLMPNGMLYEGRMFRIETARGNEWSFIPFMPLNPQVNIYSYEGLKQAGIKPIVNTQLLEPGRFLNTIRTACLAGIEFQQESSIHNPQGTPVCGLPAFSPVGQAVKTIGNYGFHVSSGEHAVLPTDGGDIGGAQREVLQCRKNGMNFSVALMLFRVGNQHWLWIYDTNMGPGTEFYTYAAFREQSFGQLFLPPGSFRVGQRREVQILKLDSLVVQACQAGMDILAETPFGPVNACRK